MDLDPETDLTFTRTLAAPRMLLWECWTTPAHIKNFFMPKPHSVTACDIDLRPGGRFNTTFLIYDEEVQKFVEEWNIPAGKFGNSDDLGAFVAMFCSQQAAFVAGQSLVIDGGQTNSTF